MPPIRRREFVQGAAAGAVLPLVGCGSSGGPQSGVTGEFRHGVASGDPLARSVILWTRFSPQDEAATDSVPLELIVARAADLAEPVVRQRVFAERARDFTVKVDVTGLQPGTTWFYAFRAIDALSPVGRTRTLPEGPTEALRLAVMTCGDFSRGFFNAYARVAEREDLDAVLHLGDYIYENDNTDRVRPHEPPREALQLGDYRTRYAQYRADPDLQACHAAHPLIWVWDDHEFDNNAWRDGAKNHDPETDGPWAARSDAALQAALEWMPIRSPDPSNPLRIYRDFAFGDLVDLHMLDTRRIGREQQIPENTVFGDNLPAFTQTGDFADPDRQLLGAEQEAWLFERLRSSGARWRLIGQQVMMAQLKVVGAANALGGGIFGNPDQWDGYAAARDRLYALLREEGIGNVVVLAGDFHVGFASDLTEDPNNPVAYNPLTGEGALATEFVTPSATSAGDPAPLLDPSQITDPGNLLEALVVNNPLIFQAPNPHIKHADSRNGYTLLEITPEHVRAEFWAVPRVGAVDAGESRIAVFRVDDGVPALRREES